MFEETLLGGLNAGIYFACVLSPGLTIVWTAPPSSWGAEELKDSRLPLSLALSLSPAKKEHIMSHHEVGDRLPLFQSPLIKSEPVTTAYNPVASSVASNEEPKAIEPQVEESPFARNDDHALHDNPQFRRHTEATNAELFYDLFFVANLTVFTQVHEVNDHYTLAQYVGFFCIMVNPSPLSPALV